MIATTYYDEAGAKHLALVTLESPRDLPDNKTDDHPPVNVAFLDPHGVTDGNGIAIVRRAGVLHADEVTQPEDSEAPRIPYWDAIDLPGFDNEVTATATTPAVTPPVPAEPSDVPPTAVPDVPPDQMPVTRAEYTELMQRFDRLEAAQTADETRLDTEATELERLEAAEAAVGAPPPPNPPTSTTPGATTENNPQTANEVAALAAAQAEAEAAKANMTDTTPNAPSDATTTADSGEGPSV